MGEALRIRPQDGPQTQFLASPADICIYGGSAGGGKTWALLFEPLRHYNNPKFGGVIFRRTYAQIEMEGGLWDEAITMYTPLGGRFNAQNHTVTFPSGMTVSFSHLQHEKNKLDWQGAQVPYFGFDQLEHFSKGQFFYMLSRLRSLSGVHGYIRATVNPDPDHWCAEFLAWWINPETGYPIPERAGVLRYFIRVGDAITWFDSIEAIEKAFPGRGIDAMSATFIPAKLSDNKILMDKDPSYLSKLRALDAVETARLLGGNWKVRRAGKYFTREMFRRWGGGSWASQTIYVLVDAAYTKKKTSDFTAWAVVGIDAVGEIWFHDSGEEKLDPAELVEKIFELMGKWERFGAQLWLEAHKMAFLSIEQAKIMGGKGWLVNELKTDGVSKDDRILEVKTHINRLHFRDIHDDWLIDRFVAWKRESELEPGEARTPDDGPDVVGYVVKVVKYLSNQTSEVAFIPKDPIFRELHEVMEGTHLDTEGDMR